MKIAGRGFEPLLRLNQPGHAAGRWTEWAQSLSGRHRRVSGRLGSPALILAERASAALNISRRVERHVRQISPRIHLSVSAILREVVARSERTVFANPETRRTASSSAEREAAVTEARAVVHADALAGPLLRVFRRFDQVEKIAMGRPSLNAPAIEELRRRVVEERERVEMRPRAEAMTRWRMDAPQTQAAVRAGAPADEISGGASMVFNRQAKADQSLARQSVAQAAGARDEAERWPSFARPMAQPQINIDQITDQVMRRIDHRIVAHRERMGRPGY